MTPVRAPRVSVPTGVEMIVWFAVNNFPGREARDAERPGCQIGRANRDRSRIAVRLARDLAKDRVVSAGMSKYDGRPQLRARQIRERESDEHYRAD
jgi:hypothetical protein